VLKFRTVLKHTINLLDTTTKYTDHSRDHNIKITLDGFLARDSICATALYATACPSIRPSHGWISQKLLKLGSCNFTTD